MKNEFCVSVPATTANLGPGFDCLGLALNLRNTVLLSPTSSGLEISVSGEGADSIPSDASNLVYRAAAALFRKVGFEPAGLALQLENRIPVGSGLGSSAAAVLAGIVGANALAGSPLNETDLVKLAAKIEGHPDNVVPAFYGGLTLVTRAPHDLLVEQIPIPDMIVVVVLPDFALPTVEARSVLPDRIPLSDAVFNLGRLGLLIRALQAGDFSKLAHATEDRLHQPYRMPLIPGMEQAVIAGRAAGAAAVTLSGAGPSAIAFSSSNHHGIRDAMMDAFGMAGLTSRAWVLSIDRAGNKVDHPD